MTKYLKPLWFTLAINALIVFADLVLSPLHAAGRWQNLLSYYLGAAHILNMPGFTVSCLTNLRPRGTWTWPGFWLSLAINLAFWGCVALAYFRLRRQFAPPSTPQESDKPPLLSRRQLLVTGGRALTTAGVGLTTYGYFAESRWLQVTRRQIAINNLPPTLDRLRIVHLTDIHHCSWSSRHYLHHLVETANSLAPDLVVLTGDYIYHDLDYVRPAAVELARLRARIGVVGVMGNHDWWANGDLTKWAFAKEGIPLIDNARRFVTPDRRLVEWSKSGLCVAGVGDLWEDTCLYDDALGGVPGGMPRVLLSHNPDVAEEGAFLASGHRVDLMLSGHTHGGQIRLPGIGAPVTNSRYGQKYASGLVAGPACPVYVSRGLGTTVMPVRIGARPEIAVLELTCATPA